MTRSWLVVLTGAEGGLLVLALVVFLTAIARRLRSIRTNSAELLSSLAVIRKQVGGVTHAIAEVDRVVGHEE